MDGLAEATFQKIIAEIKVNENCEEAELQGSIDCPDCMNGCDFCEGTGTVCLIEKLFEKYAFCVCPSPDIKDRREALDIGNFFDEKSGKITVHLGCNRFFNERRPIEYRW
jgi:hypothetical protein